MNRKNSNKNITGTQVEDAPKSPIQQGRNKFLSYRLEVIDDENIYSSSFKGNLTEEETQEMLESIQNCLYEKMADCIQMYLEQNSITYTNFVANRKPLEYNRAMELAELFLHSETCSSLNTHTSNADIYYAIIDHQQLDNKSNCEGCYIVTRKTPALNNCQHKYNIIGQIFSCNETNSDEYGYFAVRENKDNELVNNIVLSYGEPVLPTFGCVDLTALLLDIDNIRTIGQTKKAAVK